MEESPIKGDGETRLLRNAEMPVFWSPDMKHEHQAPAGDLEKRLRFLDEYKRIGNKEDDLTDTVNDNRDENEAEQEDISPSSQFFLTK